MFITCCDLYLARCVGICPFGIQLRNNYKGRRFLAHLTTHHHTSQHIRLHLDLQTTQPKCTLSNTSPLSPSPLSASRLADLQSISAVTAVVHPDPTAPSTSAMLPASGSFKPSAVALNAAGLLVAMSTASARLS
ncbi:hypothetical protein CRV24_009035 [Beauveria bassiana]|nr:hypothetical protein CRV24_009035 [Beauveria bassiana]